MMAKLLSRIASLLHLKSRVEALFIFWAMLCGFCITSDYAVVRPVSNSVFLSFFSSQSLPYVWLGALPFNLLLVFLYNRYLPALGSKKMLFTLATTILSINLFAAFFLSTFKWFPLMHFIWKELYVLLLFQALWSIIHATVSTQQARALYGVMFGIGGLGSVFGSAIPGFLALKVGSEHLLLFSVPATLLLMWFYSKVIHCSKQILTDTHIPTEKSSPAKFFEGIQLIRRSSILPFILLLVVFMQITSTLLDYQFNLFVQKAYPIKNLRTEFLGRLSALINIGSIAVQFLGSYLFLRIASLRTAHLTVPLILACNALLSLIIPGLRTLSLSFASIKVLDFSIFTIIKEMLYVKLPTQDKFQAKAVIDVFVYRTSKAAASCIILGLQALHLANNTFLSSANLTLFLLWSAAVWSLFRRYDAVEKLPSAPTA